ncbi:hypothetical protein ARMSODRAFT_118026 [Armillaria solidipes]|uniref:Mid2 domain-containing protein n=1 Tax=Armillaria solidipes TaxID=1076256 RepID=A0A2H3AP56_9AGAR|nr:hypothetical protein ARMSODRAFT_118026 [Armillaria solidipes]
MSIMYLHTLLLLPMVVAAQLIGQLINHTIDDTLGDELTGFQVSYSPAGQHSNGTILVWKNASQCSDCAVVPDRSLAMNDTWTGATYDPSMGNITAQLLFHGSAIYVYLILSNYPKSTGVVSDVICDFRMDGEVVGSYSHDTDGTYQFEYNILAYRNASLSDEDHTLVMETTGTEPSYLIFDYAVYTNTQASTLIPSSTTQLSATSSNPVSLSSSAASSISSTSSPSSSSLAKTFGGAIAVGILVLIILAASVVFYLRRLRRRQSTPATPEVAPHPHNFFQPFGQTSRQPTAVGLYDAESSKETLTSQIPAPASWGQRREVYEP